MKASRPALPRWCEMTKREQSDFAVALLARFQPSSSIHLLATYVYQRWTYANRAPDLSSAEIDLLDSLLGHEPATTRAAA